MTHQIDLDENRDLLEDSVDEAIRRAFAPPLRIRVDEWAETRRTLTKEESEIAGPYRVSTVEVARGALLAATEPGVEIIAIRTSAQLMKTSTLQNVFGWLVETRPAPILIYQPTEDSAAKFAQSKLNPMIRNTPALVRAFGGPSAIRAKSSDNKLTEKRFAGGWYAVMSAAAENNFGMHSAPYLLLDEVSKWKPLKGVASLTDLALQRAEFSEQSLAVIVSTPKELGDCEISGQIDRSDQRQPYIACPSCGHEHVYMWSDVRWEKDDNGVGQPDTAHFECPSCAHAWTEAERRMVLTTPGAVRWRQTRKFVCCGISQDPKETRSWAEHNGVGRAACVECGTLAVSNRIAGFDASALYSPRKPLSVRVREWIAAQGNPGKLQKFINEILAQPFNTSREDTHFEADPDALAARLEVQWSLVPAPVQVVTAGVDVQDDRLEVEIVGWGSSFESWSLDYHVIDGSPGDDATWQSLDEILLSQHATEDGRSLRIAAAAVDTGGHFTDAVHRFCGRRAKRRVFATQGGNYRDHVHRKPVWPAQVSKTIKHGSRLYNLGTGLAKDIVARMITATTGGQPGPYYMHVPTRHGVKGWIDGITKSEKRVSFMEGGRRASRWTPAKGGIRNEPLDCRVYALAAYEGLIATGGHRRGVIEAPGAAALPAPAPAAAVSSDGTAPPQAAQAPAAVQAARKRRPPRPTAQPGFGGFSRGRGGGSWL